MTTEIGKIIKSLIPPAAKSIPRHCQARNVRPSRHLPSYDLKTTVRTTIPRTRKINLYGVYAHLTKVRHITVLFNQKYRVGKPIKLSGMGIRVSGNTGIEFSSGPDKGMKSAFVEALLINETDGFMMRSTNTADGAVALLFGVFGLAADLQDGRRPRIRDCNCEFVQNLIDRHISNELKDYFRSNRRSLLASGYTTRLVDSVINDRLDPGVMNWSTFIVK